MNETVRHRILSLSQLSRKSEPHPTKKYISHTEQVRIRSMARSKSTTSKSKSKRKRYRRRLSSLTEKHVRHQSIKKEDRLLSTWSKIEIADWVEEEWNKNGNNAICAYVHKMKREKKFDGRHLCKLNDRNLNILAQRCLGLKKGGSDYTLFMQCMHRLKRTYATDKKKNKLHTTRYHSYALYNKQKPHKCGKTDAKEKRKESKAKATDQSAFEFPLSIRLSVTSPACLDDETCGVTEDELLSLISCGQCDSDYDSSTCDVQQYIYQNTYASHTCSPTLNNDNANDQNKHKTTVIPSILTVSDHLTPTISLSPHAYVARNGDSSMYHSMTDESTDEDEAEYHLTLTSALSHDHIRSYDMKH